MNATSVINAFSSLDCEDDVRTHEPMQRRQRRPEPRRKGHGGSGGGMHCRRNKHHTWGSGAGARLADIRAFAGAIVVALVATMSSASADTFPAITFKEVLNPGNPSNTAQQPTGLGSVSYNFVISAYETTYSQYAYFLNNSAAGKTNATGVYSSQWMKPVAAGGTSPNGGIIQNGSSGSFTYTVQPGFENRPVIGVNWFSAARFVNWYVNGANASASAETGTYTLDGQTSGNVVARNEGSKVFLPSASEWTKAAFYDSTSTSYKVYPTNSNSTPLATQTVLTGTNSANYGNLGGTLPVGSYANTVSTYGAFDMLGNVKELTDTAGGTSSTVWSMGGSWVTGTSAPTPPLIQPWLANFTSTYADPVNNAVNTSLLNGQIGFRVAAVPEPSNMIAAALGVGGLIAVHMVKRRKLALARVPA